MLPDRSPEEPAETAADDDGGSGPHPGEAEQAGQAQVPRVKKFHRIASDRLWGKRIDQYLILSGLGVSRSRAARLIEDGLVLVNGERTKPGYRVKPGDEVSAEFEHEPEITVEPQDIELDIVYEDDDIIIIDKQAGMVVHPARGNRDKTLVNALLYHCRSLPLRKDSVIRPGVVHRLDKETTGLLMFAKTDGALTSLGNQVMHRTVVREYASFAWGDFELQEGTVDAPIGRHTIDRTRMAVTPFSAKTAVTNYTVVKRYNVCTYLRLRLKTGRTHQIRVHLQHLGHPVVGDPEYGGRNERVIEHRDHMPLFKDMMGIIKRQALHAARLGFNHPRTRKYIEFTSSLPHDMEQLFFYLEKHATR